jgi:hypothetical protein
MIGYEVTSSENKVVVSIDKSLMDKEYVLKILDRLRLEYLAKKADFNESVMDLSDEIKTEWWKENKESFLK